MISQNVPTIVPRPRASSRVQRPLRRLLDDGERRHRGDGQHRDSRRDGSFVFFFLCCCCSPRWRRVGWWWSPRIDIIIRRCWSSSLRGRYDDDFHFATTYERRRQRKRVLDIALSSLLLQRRPVARRVRVCALLYLFPSSSFDRQWRL